MGTPEFLRKALHESIDSVEYNKRLFLEHESFSRKPTLTLHDTIMLLLEMNGGSLKKGLRECGVNVTPSAFSQARGKLGGSEILNAVFQKFNFYTKGMDNRGAFLYRILACDGSAINMPRNPNSPSFVKNDGTTPEGYNMLHLHALYDVANNTFVQAKVEPEPQKDEIGALVEIIKDTQFCENTLLLLDRGYASYNLFQHIIKKENLDFIARVKNSKTAMRAVASLPMEPLDVNVVFTVSTSQTKEDKERNHIFIQTHARKDKEYSQKTRAGRWDFESPCTMSFRVVRFYLSTGELETVVTSLPKFFTPDNLRDLYHLRWGVETSFRWLKYSLGLSLLHGRKDDYVLQEVYAHLTTYNFCSRVCGHIELPKKDTKYDYKINFTQAVNLVKEFLRDDTMPGIELINAISKSLTPIRPGRADQRKLRPKGFVGFNYRVPA